MLPKPPKVKDIPVPSRSSEEVQQAADNERRRAAAAESTNNWATGGMGVRDRKLTVSATQLLGG